MAPYPTQGEIGEIFSRLAQHGGQFKFMNSVAEDVKWTIFGHTPISRSYTSKTEFIEETFDMLRGRVLKEPLRLGVKQITGGGESEWAVAELSAIDAVCKNGLTYDMEYCWVCRFDKNHKIVEVRAYLDSDLLIRALEQNP